jgi:hypothetical protein
MPRMGRLMSAAVDAEDDEDEHSSSPETTTVVVMEESASPPACGRSVRCLEMVCGRSTALTGSSHRTRAEGGAS